jgi:hypothetical protein
MHRSLSILLLLTLTACGSTAAKRPANIPQPDLGARLMNPLFFGSGNEAAATIEVGVRNRAAVPIVVRRIEITTPSMGQYSLFARPRELRETLAPGEEKAFTTFATAIAQTTRRPTEPLQMRVIIEFASTDGVVWREIVMTRE